MIKNIAEVNSQLNNLKRFAPCCLTEVKTQLYHQGVVNMSDIKRFKDIPEFKRETLEGDIVPIEDILNKELVIYNYVLNDSFTFENKFAIIQASLGDEVSEKKFTFSCGGGLIIKYLEVARKNNRFPFITTLTQKLGKSGNNYYVLE